jgi:hypothetical protein
MKEMHAKEDEGTTYIVALAIALLLILIIPNTLTSSQDILKMPDIIARLITSFAQAAGFGLLLVKTVRFIENKGHVWIKNIMNESIIETAIPLISNATSETIKNTLTPLIFCSILYIKKGNIEIPKDAEEFQKLVNLIEQFSAAVRRAE